MTTNGIEPFNWWIFPLFFAGGWFLVTTLLGVVSGWYFLAWRFRDRPEAAILTLKRQSGTIGLVGASNILRLSVCPGGLRVGIMWMFGPLCRDFFVPWSEISIARRKRILLTSVELKFGRPSAGRLVLMPHVANQLAMAAANHWPENGIFLPETAGQKFQRMMMETLLPLIILPIFLGVVTHLPSVQADLHMSEVPRLQFIGTITLFYAILFGIIGLVRFFVSQLVSGNRK